MKRLGPELKKPDLKMPELKVPAFLADLYYDLRDRRLLPLVALVAVAIVAVPFLLGGEVEQPSLPVGGAETAALESGEKTSHLTVVEATPGLRDYHKRLRGRVPTDPFKQRFTAPTGGSESSSSGDATSSSGSQPSSSSPAFSEGSAPAEGAPAEAESGDASPGGSSHGGGSGGAPSGKVDPTAPGLHFFGLRPDVRFGVAGSSKLNSYPDMPIGQALPKQDPVVVLLGVSEDGKRAAFHVSNEVALVRGPGDCTGGNRSCDLLFLRVGQAVDLLTGAPNRDFRLAVDGIDFIEVDPPKAAHTSAVQRQRDYGFSQSFIK
ncbi:MAG TPA: hypothetical protein VLK89_05940 [Solirubrobacterales bacterium]|nr:hypothetical protein [Solirubrobacterales bacterium]